jgi:hypothetical protein
VWLYLVVFLWSFTGIVFAQAANPESIGDQIRKLTEAMASTQAQLEQSQRQLNEMRKQLNALQQQLGQSQPTQATDSSPSALSSSSTKSPSEPADATPETQDLRDQFAMLASQVAIQEQAKVESESKFPVKVTGLVLLTGFVNTGAVDVAATPTVALPGPGSTGATLRQTELGFDARGPHLFGASSFADLRADFDGVPQSTATANAYSGAYSANVSFLRLRTAHADMQWKHTQAYFSLDRPIISPDSPTSLTAVAEPALAWSGNLWTWNPQIGVTQELPISPARGFQVQAALIDAGDAPLTPISAYASSSPGTAPSSAEQSRWPGVEARVALLGPKLVEQNGNHFGLGGYFAPHRDPAGNVFDSWAGTIDTRLLLPARLEFTANAYRGAALGGLGGGAYKDFAIPSYTDSGAYHFHPLDDVGGWAQLKEKFSERLELNAAFGMDDVFADELRENTNPGSTFLQYLSRNRTYTGNAIYKPSSYLLFSIEYRHLESSPVLSPSAGSNVIGLGTGFKF